MDLYSYREFKPQIDEGVFVAPNATVIGRVHLKKNSNIWYGCVLRGDINEIIIGENTNIQDLSMLHVVKETPLLIGSNVTVGHNVVLHACTVEDSCLIGMGAIILDGAVIGEGSLVAAGSVVPPGKIYPPKSFIVGSPAVAKRELREDELEVYNNHYTTYIESKNEFLNSDIVKKISTP